MIAVLVVIVVLAVLSIAVPASADLVGPVGLFLGTLAAGITFVVQARHLQGREQRSWTMVGLGVLTVCAGIVVVGVLGAQQGGIAAFGPHDIVFLGGYLLVIVGFGSLPQIAGTRAQRVRTLLDGLIGAVSFGVVAWTVLFADLFAGIANLGGWERWAGIAYPLADVGALIVFMVVMLRRSAYRLDLRLLFLAGGLVAQTIADVLYLERGIGKTFADAQPVYWLNMAAFTAFFTMALFLQVKPERREYADRRASLVGMAAPYGVTAVMVWLMVSRLFQERTGAEFLVLAAGSIVVIAFIFIRQALAIRENREIVERERRMLISSISHELRTPLTAVVGFLDLVVDEVSSLSDEERSELILVAHQQSSYMARIVSDLILLARGSMEDLDLEFRETRVDNLTNAALATLDVRGVSITMHVDHEMRVFVDWDRMQQVLVNLLSNAIRYGRGRVEFRATAVGGDLIMEVHDDGPGVPKKHELMIWERFERGAHRLDATKPGSGIGLSIVRAIIRAHGGTAIYRRSELLGGACFEIRLPRRVIRSAEPGTSRRLTDGKAGQRSRIS